jgi:hypothetical protein
MRVAQHLDLDMAGALDQLFQIDLVLAEGGAGTPTSTARLRAATLLPSRRMVSGFGPMKMTPFAAQASANSGLSDNRP